MTETVEFYAYWGKAGDQSHHLLVYHALDVAAVARNWLDRDPILRDRFRTTAAATSDTELRWLLFFIALHDLGKFDIRFQWKRPELGEQVYSGCEPANELGSRGYYHGDYSHYWLFEDLAGRYAWKVDEDSWDEPEGEAIWQAWQPWVRAVAGHHGKEPSLQAQPDGQPPMVARPIRQRDRDARLAFIAALEGLFLRPAGLSLDDLPPACDLEFVAGFCSVCDWLGSMTDNAAGEPRFAYRADPVDLSDYFRSRLPIAAQVLDESGLLSRIVTAGGMAGLYPDFQPRQLQTLVDTLPTGNALTLIEAPTGSGKTETALAYAARLLAAGQAESIVFALPSQATADAMLQRLEDVAPRLFAGANLVLAHGKSRFNPGFIDLKKKAGHDSAYSEHEIEAGAQCALWLAQSRKRVFLGQIGVCTIDQVLMSALPVRHRFVRGFGLGRSVLIVDEVHAYDAYMYQLLDKVLRRQKTMHGAAILLSATLPLNLRRALLESWDGDTAGLNEDNPYPLITQAAAAETRFFELPAEELERLQRQQAKTVQLRYRESGDMLPDPELEQQLIAAARNGAGVAVICNLVADAQALAGRLTHVAADIDVMLFHSRYRFDDRQRLQQQVMRRWGKDSSGRSAGILVATQVIEQSLDLDFDWMITQLCPIDLLFQRLGRLHRHPRPRPPGFEQPACTVLLPEGRRYELHQLIYGQGGVPNERVLWRSEQQVRKNPELHFPNAYRPLIEEVYREDAWPDEPPEVVENYEAFWQAEDGSRSAARLMSDTDTEWAWDDDDERVGLLTRDGEMSLTLVPVILDAHGRRCFIDDDRPIAAYEEWQRAEKIMRNSVPVPASWHALDLPDASPKDGLIWLVMQPAEEGGWQWASDSAALVYTLAHGLMKLTDAAA
jgi:CRISPR-associated endonuclease/helicase Cas3